MTGVALEFSDDQITALIADPLQIANHETAMEVIAVLDAEIADIQAQIDAAMIQATVRPLTPDREAWMRRAAYAAAMRRNDRHKVYQRDKELRGTKGPARTSPKKDPSVLLAKQERLKAEADDRREKRALKIAEVRLAQEQLEATRTKNACFVAAARALLPPDLLARVEKEAQARRATARNPKSSP